MSFWDPATKITRSHRQPYERSIDELRLLIAEQAKEQRAEEMTPQLTRLGSS